MYTHSSIWDAIDALAKRHDLSVSGLARLAGLDATAFNPSKRIGKDGRNRWPSTESIAKILQTTEEDYAQFMAGGGFLHSNSDNLSGQDIDYTVPLLGFAQAGAGGFFDPAGYPVGQGWEEVSFPGAEQGSTYALAVTGDSMNPAYRDGDILIVSPTEQLRRGDRIVVRTADGEVTAKILHRKTNDFVELHSLNPQHIPRTIALSDIEWIARILWASQ